MVVFQFMSAAFGLDDLYKRRLKVSAISDMNDPFELLGGSLTNQINRRALLGHRDHIGEISRVLCFSKNWTNPVLWSHYADKHRGLCLGFEIPNENLTEVSYETDRLKTDLESDYREHGTVGSDTSRKLLSTKYIDWRYEDEVRMFVRL